jgi:acetolactate synthase I/II/III large subunit
MVRRGREWVRSENCGPALEAAFSAGGVHLVIVPVDYSENKGVLVDELRQRVPALQEV